MPPPNLRRKESTGHSHGWLAHAAGGRARLVAADSSTGNGNQVTGDEPLVVDLTDAVSPIAAVKVVC
ncbi:hypothetical protein [Streptomyces sp. NBC_00648]|uniref:hypothetical protein n=1 Tax=Streptomyces sp. NBC_00648 TaxID=2975797 RepID=UPI003253F7E9